VPARLETMPVITGRADVANRPVASQSAQWLATMDASTNPPFVQGPTDGMLINVVSHRNLT
jgi:hypothetical protein